MLVFEYRFIFRCQVLPREKRSTPNSNSRRRASSRRQWCVPYLSSGDTAVRVFQNPYQPMVIRADPYQSMVIRADPYQPMVIRADLYQPMIVRALLAPDPFLLRCFPLYKYFSPIVPPSFPLPRPLWCQNIAAAAATAVQAVVARVRRTVATAVAAEVAVGSTC